MQPPKRTAVEQAVLEALERSQGKLTDAQAEWALQQARAIGEI